MQGISIRISWIRISWIKISWIKISWIWIHRIMASWLVPLLLLLLLLYLPSQGQCQDQYQGKCQNQGQRYAQIKSALPSSHCQRVCQQQIVDEFITLILDGDICALLDRCEVPPLSKAQRRPLFSIFPPRGQTQVRLQRDKLLRHYIDLLRELIIVVHRLNISKRSEISCCPASDDSPDHFSTQVKIKTPPSPLAFTVSPDLDGKSVLLTFTLAVNCSGKKWKITDISRSSFFVITGY